MTAPRDSLLTPPHTHTHTQHDAGWFHSPDADTHGNTSTNKRQDMSYTHMDTHSIAYNSTAQLQKQKQNESYLNNHQKAKKETFLISNGCHGAVQCHITAVRCVLYLDRRSMRAAAAHLSSSTVVGVYWAACGRRHSFDRCRPPGHAALSSYLSTVIQLPC